MKFSKKRKAGSKNQKKDSPRAQKKKGVQNADALRAPSHLKNGTREWWENVVTNFELEAHHIKILTLAGEAWDRCVQARKCVAKYGLTSRNRYGEIRARPEVAIERDSRIAFARLLRELNLDIDLPEPPRAPGLKFKRGGER